MGSSPLLYLPERPMHFAPGRVLAHDPRNDDPDHWQKIRFSVPEWVGQHPVTEADVQDKVPHFRNKAGAFLEREGYRVLYIEGAVVDNGAIARAGTDPDRRAYVMWARVERRPIEYHMDIPDEDVETALAGGMKLNE